MRGGQPGLTSEREIVNGDKYWFYFWADVFFSVWHGHADITENLNKGAKISRENDFECTYSANSSSSFAFVARTRL